MRTRKRFLSTLLTLALLLSLLPANALAAEDDEKQERQTDLVEQTDIVITMPGLGSVDDIGSGPMPLGLQPDNTFSGTTYYNQLNATSQQIYTKIKESALGVGQATDFNAEVSLGFSKTWKNVTYTRENESQLFSLNAKTQEEVNAWLQDIIANTTPALLALLYDYPQISWLVNVGQSYGTVSPTSGTVTTDSPNSLEATGDYVVSDVTFSIAKTGEYADTWDEVCNSSNDNYTGTLADINSAVSDAKTALEASPYNINGSSSTYDEVKAIHDYICNTVSYTTGGDLTPRRFQTVYSALVKHETVCAGYAKAFKVLCDAYDIPCILVSGTSNSQNHMWNYVQMDTTWYAVDATWDDSGNPATPATTYFLKGTDVFTTDGSGTNNHTPNGNWGGFGFTFAYPELSSTAYVHKTALTGTPIIHGTPKVGEKLTVNVDNLNDKTNITYQWCANETDISGATESSYTLAPADAGKNITVKVTATDASSYTGTVTAASVGPVANASQTAPVIGNSDITGKTDTTITVTENSNWEYSKDGGSSWQGSNVFSGLAPNSPYNICVRLKATIGYNDSPASNLLSVTTAKSSAGTPVSPTVTYKNDTTIKVEVVSGQKYMIKLATDDPPTAGNSGWGDIGDFSGLTPNTAYRIYTYIPETSTVVASSVVCTEATTDKAPITDALVPVSNLSKTYNAVAQEPTYGGSLTKDTHYTVSYAVKSGGKGMLKDNKPCGAGTYVVTVSGTGDYGGSFTKEMTIGQKSVTITGLSAGSKEYDGNTSATITGTATIEGTISGDAVTVSNGTAQFADKNVGTGITVTFTGFSLTGEAADNYSLTAQPANVTADITAKPVTVSVSATDREYDGTTSVALVVGSVTGKVDDDDVSVNISSATGTIADADVGNNKGVTVSGVTLAGTDAGNYSLSAQPTGVTVSITAKSISDAAINLGTQATYDGTKKSVVITSVKLGETSLSKDTNYTIKSGGTATNVGNTTLTIEGTGNYSGEATTTWSLVAKSVDSTMIGDVAAQPYTGSAITPTPDIKDGSTLSQGTDFTYSYESNTYVGTAKVKITGTGNYQGTAEKEFSITAVNQTPTITSTASLTRGGNTLDLSTLVSNVKGNADVSFSIASGNAATLSGNTLTSETSNTGEVKISVTIAAKSVNEDSMPEYNEYIGTNAITVTVTTKNTSALPNGVSQTGCTYGETLAVPTYTKPANTICETITYNGTLRKDNSEYSSETKPSEAGTYTVTVKCETADTIYTGTSGAFTIAPKPITDAVVTLGTALTYTGSSQDQSVTSVKLGSTDITGDCTVSNNSGTNAGDYTLTVTAKDASNYTGSVTEGFTIAKADSSIASAPTAVSGLAYTGSAQNLVTAGTANGGTMQYALSNDGPFGDAIPTGTDAVTYSVYYKVAGDDNHTDTTAAGPVSVTINKAAPTVTTPTAKSDLSYTGSAQELVNAGSVTGGTIEYKVGSGAYGTSVPTGTDVGSYTVSYKITGDANHNNVAETSLNVTISKAASPTVSGLERTFVRTTATADNTINIAALLPANRGTTTYTVTSSSYTALENVNVSGTGILTYDTKVMESETTNTITVKAVMQNYGDVTVTVTVKLVNKTPVTITGVTAKDGTYNGSAQSGYSGAPSSTYAGAYTVTYSGRAGTAYSGTAAPVNAGSYTVTISVPADDAAYTGSVALDFTIAKATITITSGSKSAYVGDAVPTLSSSDYTVTGLASGDSLATAPTVAYASTPDMTKAGTVAIKASGAAVPTGGNYNDTITYVDGTLTISSRPYYSGGSSSSNTSTSTTTNKDGSTTTTTTNKTTGTVTEVTKEKDGTTTTVETKKDGTVTETVKTTNGTTGTVVTDKNGDVTEVKSSVSSTAAREAAKTGEAVTLPVEVPAAKTTEDAPAVQVTVPKASGSVKVEIPVEKVTPGTVAVIVNADGTEKIVSTSMTTENGVALTISGAETVKIIDNSKSFTDVPKSNVFYNEIASLSAREIMVGKTDNKFDLHNSVTLNQIANVAGRIVGAVDVKDYNAGIAWGAEYGLKTGNVAATRGDVLKALYIAAGSPIVADTSVLARFNDAGSIPADLMAAAAWAAQNGILKGNVDGSAGLGNNVTRGQACALAGRTMGTLA